MNQQLKRRIVEFVLDNQNEFQLNNATTDKFKPYMFDDKGEWLIGGEETAEFISKAIKLLA